MRRALLLLMTALVATATVGIATAGSGAAAGLPTGFWVAGDFHVHTIYGHDTCITPLTAWDPTSPKRSARRKCEDAYTVGFTPQQRLRDANARGLDFVALTDHNNVLNQTDPELLSWLHNHPGFVFIPAYENSQPGHVQMLGARSCYGNAGAIRWQHIECDQAVADQSAAGETALANGLRADGGVFQINHPSDMNWLSRYGYDVVPDTVEVWNIGPWVYQHPFPASNDNDFSLRWYDGFLQAGYQVAVTGGSDSHWVTTDPAQGVGEPTTWVYVQSRTEQGILDGLRAHRTFVSSAPPAAGGAQAFLESDADGDGHFDGMVGSTTSPSAAFRVRTDAVAAGSLLHVVTDLGDATLPLTTPTYTFRLGQGGIPAAAKFVRVEVLRRDAQQKRQQVCDPVIGSQTTVCRDRLVMEALTSPIYIG